MADTEQTPFEAAKANFEAAEGPIDPFHSSSRIDICPGCGGRMNITKEYKGEDAYHMTGVCMGVWESQETGTDDSGEPVYQMVNTTPANPEHNIERYGYYSNEGSDI